MKLSIITPYYNTLSYTLNLANCLLPQLRDDVEWIIIDDGCYQKELDDIRGATVVHLPKNSGNASIPRNYGLTIAQGKYIAFIDSDDIVSSDYVEEIINKMEEDFDYCYIGWQHNNGINIIEEEAPEWNTCVWNCVYRKSLIGDTRFDPNKNVGEDESFNNAVRHGKRSNIKKVMYYYTTNREGSLIYNYCNGLMSADK